MRLSKLFGGTLREAPADLALGSHILMMRAGLIRRLPGGGWGLLPIGRRVMAQIERLSVQEMEAGEAQPAYLGSEPGEGVLPVPLTDRLIGLARREIKSYRDLPRCLYQIGPLLHSIDRSAAPSFQPVWSLVAFSMMGSEAGNLEPGMAPLGMICGQMLSECGVPWIGVAAHPGLDGAHHALAFIAPSVEGQDQIVRCGTCGYTALVSVAAFSRRVLAGVDDTAPMQKVATPGCATIADLCAFLGIAAEQTLKAVFYTANPGLPAEQTVMVMVRGDLEISEAKLKPALEAASLRPATDHEIRSRLGAEPGYASPVGLPSVDTAYARIIADLSLEAMQGVVTGANENGYHLIHARHGRDFQVSEILDVAAIPAGARCSRCDSLLRYEKGLYLGIAARLDHDARRLGLPMYAAADGVSEPIRFMGIHLDLERVLQAVVEGHHDEYGILWPQAIAPYDVHLIGLAKTPEAASAAEDTYAALMSAGISVLYDDRGLSPGVMFADADLIGVPLRITLSPRSLESGGAEVKRRNQAERGIVALDAIVDTVIGSKTE